LGKEDTHRRWGQREEIIQRIPSEEIDELEDGSLFWTKNPEELALLEQQAKGVILKKLLAIFIREGVNTNKEGYPPVLGFTAEERQTITTLIEQEVQQEYGECF